MATSNPTQQLEQGLLQKFGWVSEYSLTKAEGWIVVVSCGQHGVFEFASNDHSPDSIKGRKIGRAAAAAVAVLGLQPIAALEAARQVIHAEQLYQCTFKGKVAQATPEQWVGFWSWRAAQGLVAAVAIDCEGFPPQDLGLTPMLIQVATDEMILMELPGPQRQLSPDMQKLLSDNSIVKVFCDGTRSDRRALGLPTELSPTVQCIEDLANQAFGMSKVSRGLCGIASLVLEPRVTKGKSYLSFFLKAQSGYMPSTLDAIPPQEALAAAVDAWLTLYAWRSLSGRTMSSSGL